MLLVSMFGPENFGVPKRISETDRHEYTIESGH